MRSPITKRFIECHDKLKEEKIIPSSRQFAQSLDYLPQSLSEVNNGKRDIPLEVMRKAVDKYSFNPVYMCTGKGPMFLNNDNPSGLQVLSVVTNSEDEEKIVHVPIPAQAGYVDDLTDPEFISTLPSYNLPDYIFKQGTFRSFDVKGESMSPTLETGDKVICKFLDPDYWATDLKENEIYVVVSRNGIVVKRIQNRLRNRNLSD